MNKFFSIFALFFFVSFTSSDIFDQGMKGPRSFLVKKFQTKKSINEGEISTASWVLKSIISIYSTTVGEVDGTRCPSYPTCSIYGRIVLKENGPFHGIFLIAPGFRLNRQVYEHNR